MPTRPEKRSAHINLPAMALFCVSIFCLVSAALFVAYPRDEALSLWLYFGYMTAACTFIPLSTPQMAMDYGLNYPLLAPVLGGIGSCLSGLVDYTIVTLALKNERIARVKTARWYLFVERIFLKAPFAVLAVAAFTPVPFEPVRVLACATRYNRAKYVLAIFLGRAPRYFLLGALQRELVIPRAYLYGSIVVLVVAELLRRLVKRLLNRDLPRRS